MRQGRRHATIYRLGLEQKPAVIAIAARLRITPAEAAIAALRMWSLMTDGAAGPYELLSADQLDAACGVPAGFTAAMIDVGWLKRNDGGWYFPRYAYHHAVPDDAELDRLRQTAPVVPAADPLCRLADVCAELWADPPVCTPGLPYPGDPLARAHFGPRLADELAAGRIQRLADWYTRQLAAPHPVLDDRRATGLAAVVAVGLHCLAVARKPSGLWVSYLRRSERCRWEQVPAYAERAVELVRSSLGHPDDSDDRRASHRLHTTRRSACGAADPCARAE